MMFSEMFLEQNADQIDYNGKTINSCYSVKEQGIYNIKFSIISTSSDYTQAINIHFIDFEGRVFVNGREHQLSESSFPQLLFSEKEISTVEVKIELQQGSFVICNASDPIGTDEIWYSLYGNCAMIIEKYNDLHYRFYCNDHEYDDDFDDMIFDMRINDEKVKSTGKIRLFDLIKGRLSD